jgi:hypothetical protein
MTTSLLNYWPTSNNRLKLTAALEEDLGPRSLA